MRRLFLIALILVGSVTLVGSAFAQMLPGATVEERCINGARQYIQKNNLKAPTLTVMLNGVNMSTQPKYDKQWEELTRVKINLIPYGFTDMPSKIMAEAVAKTGQWDVFNHFPYSVPDAVGAGVMQPMDEYAARVKPDFSGMPASFEAMQYFNGKLYFLIMDGDNACTVLRKDIMNLAKDDYKKKFGKECGCPETMDELEEMAKYFQTKKGETRWGKTFDQPLYGHVSYRMINFAYRFFPAYFGGLLFDRDMNPRINSPQGIEAITKFCSIVKYMPEDVMGWATPQIYPFWASGQAFSATAFPSIIGYTNTDRNSVIKGHQLVCQIPGVMRNGKLVRRSTQLGGGGFALSHYGKHPELAYYYIQWLAGPTKNDELIADPKSFWDPFRKSNLTNPAIWEKYGGKEAVVTLLADAENNTSLIMLEGNDEYYSVMDKAITQVIQGNITASEAAKEIEEGWNKITNDIGRDHQIRVWRAGVEKGAYMDKF